MYANIAAIQRLSSCIGSTEDNPQSRYLTAPLHGRTNPYVGQVLNAAMLCAMEGAGACTQDAPPLPSGVEVKLRDRCLPRVPRALLGDLDELNDPKSKFAC